MTNRVRICRRAMRALRPTGKPGVGDKAGMAPRLSGLCLRLGYVGIVGFIGRYCERPQNSAGKVPKHVRIAFVYRCLGPVEANTARSISADASVCDRPE